MNLEQYLNEGLETLVKDAMRGTLKNPKETAFLVQYGLSAKKAESLRHKAAQAGEHIPSFLIASITSRCNLQCAGCYDRAREDAPVDPGSVELKRSEWGRVFKEAEALGFSAILLAGGEPLIRNDVLEEAAHCSALLFPVFTNGTMMDDATADFFEKHRNLIPIISIEGNEELTDNRRGSGVYAQTMQAMEKLQAHDLLFGVSITVTRGNIEAITAAESIRSLKAKGCRAAVFVEYVPVADYGLALDSEQQRLLEERIAALREQEEMILISFPGDEKKSGGCLAAGRGFFHISASGGVEPCPFSPYSDTNLKTASLREALQSPLFRRLQEKGTLLKEHTGGCVLFEQASTVQALAQG